MFLISTLAIKLIKRNRNKNEIKSTYINEYKKDINTKKIFEKEKYNNNIKIINSNSNENNKCYLSTENAKIKLAHLILTRFIFEFEGNKVFQKLIYSEAYIKNGIRTMKKYLFPSLENQSCKNFIWILLLGDKADMSYIKSLLDLNTNSFESLIMYQKDFKNYVKDISKGLDFLLTTRIDSDDCIYYDAVNDVRKLIDINKPIFLHGYNKGVYYFEANDKYYDYYNNFDNRGVMSIFISLILNLNKVNDTITIFDLGDHTYIKKTLLKKYKSFGIKELDYDPSLFDESSQKFIYVRQNFSISFDFTQRIPQQLTPIEFNISKLFGK